MTGESSLDIFFRRGQLPICRIGAYLPLSFPETDVGIRTLEDIYTVVLGSIAPT